MIVGYSANNVAVLDKLVPGGKPPVREYSQMDHVNPDYASLAVGGRQLCVSIKGKLNSPATVGGTKFLAGTIPVLALIPAAGQTTTAFDPYIVAHAKAAAALPKPTMLGEHTVVHYHEPDVGTLNGSPSQLCQAIIHANDVARAVPGFTDTCEIGVIIGDYNFALIAQFQAALRDADKVLVDQPYIPAGVAPGGVKAFMDQRFNAMRALGVKRFGIGEWGVRTGLANRPAAIQECLTWFDAQPDIDVVYYWDAPDVAITNTPEQAGFISAVNSHLITPAQQIAQLESQLATATALNTKYKSALTAADAIIHPLV